MHILFEKDWNTTAKKIVALIKRQRRDDMDIIKTRAYYEQIKGSDLCSCDYCRNYISEIKSSYPELAEYLCGLGIDIEKPFETMPLEPDKSGYIDYLCAQYIVFGNPDDFAETTVGSVDVSIAEMHPSTQTEEPHFVIEASPIRLKWVM